MTGTVIINDRHNDRELDVLYVFCSVDEDGMRGIVAHIMPGLGSTPFVTGSPNAVEHMKRIAPQIARETGKRVVLYEYTRGADLWSTDN